MPRVPLLAAPLLLAACAAPEPVPWAAPARPAASSDRPAPSPDDRPVLDLSAALAAAVPLPPATAEPRGLVPGGGGDPAVAEVDGVPVRASEVARFLFRYDPRAALEGLNQILDTRILEADAAAAGVTLPPGEIEARARARIRDQENEIRVQFGPGMTLERYLRERFGFTPESFRRDVEALVRLQALRDRLVRYEGLREDRIRIRVLVLPDEAAARDAAARLREGADFTSLARQVSLAPPEDLPSYGRADIEPADLAEELFAMAPGEVSRPVRVSRDGRELFEVFKVIESRRGRDLPWAAFAEEIERGLRERPVAPAEYLQWARRARERHGVRILLEEPAGGSEAEGAEEGGGR